MNVLRRFRIRVSRPPGTRFTVQDLADFVELCARRDLDPSTPVTLMVRGQREKHFDMEAEGGERDAEGNRLRAVHAVRW